MKAYRGTKPVKNNFFLILCLKIFGIAFTLYIQKFEKNEVVNIFTYGPEWVKETVVETFSNCQQVGVIRGWCVGLVHWLTHSGR